MSSEPLRITWRLRAPMVRPGRPMHADDLLAAMAVAREREREAEDPLAVLDALPLDKADYGDEWVYKASTLGFVTESAAWQVSLIRRIDYAEDARAYDRVFPGGKKVGKTYTPGTGPWKNFILPRQLQWMERVVAYVVGDRAEIEALAGRVTRIGRNRNRGYGTVASCEVTPDEAAAERWMHRALPEPATSDYRPVEGNLRSPYWDRTAAQVVYMPRTPLLEPDINPSTEEALA